jgi:PAS domain S-box-containing protein
MALYGNPQLTGHERTFDQDDLIVTKTDPSGRMTYVNRTFLRLAGYSEKECLGAQHNMIRHPHMPRAVFDLLWRTLQARQEIFAYVVNRSKNGDHYWVFAHVTPSFDSTGNVVGYHSNRRAPDMAVVTRHIVPLYDRLLKIEQAATSPKDGLAASVTAVGDLLAENKVEFNQMMLSLSA